MSIFNNGPVLLALAILCLIFSQISRAQGVSDEDFAPREFPIIEDFDSVLPQLTPTKSSTIYTVNDREVTLEECERAEEAGQRCTATAHAFEAVPIPKYAAPFQAQIVTTPVFKSDTDFQRQYPDKQLWELRHVCGGALIAPEWVLTAAHCFNGVGPDEEKFGVRLDVGNLAQTSSQTVAIKKIIRHPGFERGKIGNDIALVQLAASESQLAIMPFKQTDDGSLNEGRDIRNAMILGGGKTLITLGEDNVVKLWDIESGLQRSRRNLGGGEKIFNMEAQRLFVSKYQTLRQIDLKTLEYGPKIDHGAALSGQQISKNGRRVLTWGAGVVKLWNADNGTLISELAAGEVYKAKVINNDRILVMNSDFSVRIWDSGSRQALLSISNVQLDEPVIWPESGHVFIAEGDTILRIDANSGVRIDHFLVPDGLLSFEVTENKERIIAMNNFGHPSIWNLKTGRKEKNPAGQDGVELSMLIRGQSGGRLLMNIDAAKMAVWDMETERLLPTILLERPVNLLPLILFDNGNRILSSRGDGVTRVWDANTGNPIYKIDHSVPISRAALSDDERDILSYGDFGIAEVWDAKTGQAKTRVFHGGSVLGSKLYNNGNTLLTWGSAGKARLWDVPQMRAAGDAQTTKVDQEVARFIHGAHIRTQSGHAVTSRIKPSLVSLIQRSRNSGAPAAKKDILTFGWGKTRPVPGYEPSAVLRMIALSAEDKSTCLSLTNTQGEKRGQLTAALDNKTLFCAQAPGRKHCKGDSGGPVVRNDEIVGIVSLGGYSCGEDGKPGYYTRVGAYADWISDEMKKARAE